MNWTQPKLDGVAPGIRAYHSFVQHGNDLLVFGGVDGNMYYNDLYALKSGKEWSKSLMPKYGKPPSPRCGHSMTVVEGSIFVLGGMFETRYYSDINVLDYETLTWSRPRIIGMVPTARAHHSCTVIGTKLIVFGGIGERGCTNDVGVLDCKSFLSNTGAMFWTRPVIQGKAPPPRSNHTASFVGSNLYLFGGMTERGVFNDLHILHLDTMSWSKPAVDGTAPMPRADHVAVVYGDKIFIQGGFNGTKYFDDLFIFDTSTSAWSTVNAGGKKMTARAQHSGCLYNNKVFFFGGFYGGLYMKALDIRVGGFGRVNDVNILELDKTLLNSNAGAGASSASRSAAPAASSSRADAAPEKMQLNEFDQGATLGTGSFGRVKVAKHKPTGKFYALKILKKYDIVKMKQLDHLKNEIQILNLVKHPFMVNMYGTFQDEKFLYIILEYVVGGEFFTLLRNKGRFSNAQAQFYASEILLALEHLHSKRILYRDLKPENLLIDSDGHAKVTDFGFAKMVEDRTFTLCGTPEYLAPEILENKGHHKGVDYWAFGVLIYEMLAGYPPFYHEDHLTMYRYILAGKIEFPKTFDSYAKDLVKKLLTKDLTKRYGCLKNGALDIKNHKWFKGVNWSDVFERKANGPFVPDVKHEGDTSNFDKYPEEDDEPKKISPDDQKLFTGF